MFNLRNLPIRSKLMLIMMFTSTVALVLSGMAFVVTDYLSMRQQAGDDVTTLAEIVAANNGAAVLFGDQESAQETLDFIQNQSYVRSAVVYDRMGTPLASYSRDKQSTEIPPVPEITGKLVFHKGHASLFKDVVVENNVVGTVFLSTDMSKLEQRLALYIPIACLVLLGALVIAFLLSAKLQRIVTDPLVYLAALVHRISTQKDYSLRAEGEGNDEIGNLISGFNEMLSEIQIRDTMLEKHGEELEKRVRQRTGELEDANRELEIAKSAAEFAARKMTHQAHHDALTGLPNRSLLNDRIKQALARAKRGDLKMAVLFLDLDHFKVINDSLGHGVGDHLLCTIAERLQHCVRSEDTVARLGGDEFTILLTEIQEVSDAEFISNKIIEALKQPVTIEGHELHVTTSLGISIYPDDGTDPEVLVKNADISMYRAKELGRNKIMYYTADMNVDSRRRLSLANAIRAALSREEFELHFQPMVETLKMGTLGAETLIRWESPELGIVPPDEFIPVAEEMGLIPELGEWVLLNACRQHRVWSDAGYGELNIAVNISHRQLGQGGNFIETIEKIIKETGVDPHKLELEITESVIMQDPTDASIILGELKDMGITISMDDFGSGYSSLSYLRRLPVDIVKIDRAFVRDIPEDKEDASIATAIIAMAHNLGLTVVAEGVESNAQLLFFREHGCDAIQGNFISPAISGEAFLEYLKRIKHPWSAGLN